MIQIFKNTNYNFVGLRYFAYVISTILVLSGIVGIVQIYRGQANLGIDFSGGSVVSIKFKEEMDVSKIRAALDKNDIKDTSIQQIADALNEPKLKIHLRIKKSNIKVGKIGETINGIIKTEFPGKEFIIDRTEDMGPAVSKTIQEKALWAIILAMIGITIYIWFRFEFKFGIAALIATIHDVFALIGVFYLLDKEFSLLIVTALMTIAGYSLTDTVVVFDRIRDNLRFRSKDSLKEIINLSVNEVLSRTIITGISTLLAVLSLFIFGGEVIHDFSFALFIGIVIGTYSSIFVASPILLEWERLLVKNTNKK